ncbi:hypothetical protein RintRC_1840 [Richelia intracellularis]|nr:hypothetical protein RintRC_1840 [Richelia intracellularis]
MKIRQKMVRYHCRDHYQPVLEILYCLEQLTSPQPSVQESPTTYLQTAVEAPIETPVGPTDYSQPPPLPIPAQATSIWLHKTLGIVKFLPFIRVIGLFLFKSVLWMILLGISLIAVRIGLFLLRSQYPSYFRKYDAIFAVLFCICGIIFFLQ